MSRHLDNLSRVLLELRDRYGSLDPMVLEVKQELDACQDRESQHLERLLPFGERRMGKRDGFDWSARLRKNLRPTNRQDVVGRIRRIDPGESVSAL